MDSLKIWLFGITLGAMLALVSNYVVDVAFAQGDLAFTVVKVTGTTTGMSFERYENTEAVCYKLGNISCFKK